MKTKYLPYLLLFLASVLGSCFIEQGNRELYWEVAIGLSAVITCILDAIGFFENFTLSSIITALGRHNILVKDPCCLKRVANYEKIIIDERCLYKSVPVVNIRNIAGDIRVIMECLEAGRLTMEDTNKDVLTVSKIIYELIGIVQNMTYYEFILDVARLHGMQPGFSDSRFPYTCRTRIYKPGTLIGWGQVDDIKIDTQEFKDIQINQLYTGDPHIVFYDLETDELLGYISVHYEFKEDLREFLTKWKSKGKNFVVYSSFPESICKRLEERIQLDCYKNDVVSVEPNIEGDTILPRRLPNTIEPIYWEKEQKCLVVEGGTGIFREKKSDYDSFDDLMIFSDECQHQGQRRSADFISQSLPGLNHLNLLLKAGDLERNVLHRIKLFHYVNTCILTIVSFFVLSNLNISVREFLKMLLCAGICSVISLSQHLISGGFELDLPRANSPKIKVISMLVICFPTMIPMVFCPEVKVIFINLSFLMFNLPMIFFYDVHQENFYIYSLALISIVTFVFLVV